ncbi:type 4 prepilin peptidase 1 [Vulcanimicrobium alpinum]|uniref:Type 4 prepilin peptidase 1 n=1 Tax=Vulcanimicrobium alpinum TaxID=3016050 RepID=A0AAN1XXZ6_UNVUL|nr:prepilin peptidase [Vulcanimicrobium alpinum]BDE07014.1 type 4 prepilin peptidase 1 [Vulcanimicrobium alpinum]
MTITTLLLLAATLVAAAIDVRTRRIPNLLTGGLAFAAIGIHVPAGLGPAGAAVAAMLAAFALGTVAFSLGWFGGGDVKLIAAASGLVSFPDCIALVAYILAAGALLSLVSAAVNGRLVSLVRSTIAVATHGAPTETNKLPYGIAIAAGSLFYSLSQLVPSLRLPL